MTAAYEDILPGGSRFINNLQCFFSFILFQTWIVSML